MAENRLGREEDQRHWRNEVGLTEETPKKRAVKCLITVPPHGEEL